MQSITININNSELTGKIIGFLEGFRNDGLEIVSKEDRDDLTLLVATRGEEAISFDDYVRDENQYSQKRHQ
uniref:Uncharacterized protein n=1 Tax=Candidatus Kentrum sp. DK TaxID=2126562 RepID=A0A450SBE7_9GAMM|nr:MAG: hypothetical protein BECKDK2373B_GA0170837_10254 [Candidatus Kentron sp. DK]